MSLMLMVIASLLFTLLEGSRYIMLGMMAVINSQSVTESMFAEYNVPAYKNYHLFMIDSGYGSGELQLSKINAKMQILGQENLNPSVKGLGKYQNFLQMDVTGSSVIRYETAADHNAGPLLAQAAEVMKKEVVSDLAQQAYQKITNIDESCKKGEKTDTYLNGALDTLEQAEKAAQEAENAGKQTNSAVKGTNNAAKKIGMTAKKADIWKNRLHADNKVMQLDMEHDVHQSDSISVISVESSENEADHPMEDVKSAKSSPLLAQILPDAESISVKQIASKDVIENRTLNTGNYGSSENVKFIDKMLIIQYLKKYTSNFRNKINIPHALQYEQEYILFGKYSDEDNLKKMANRMLLLREGMNFAYLLTDSAKCEEAFAMAAAIAAAAVIPAAVKPIQMGILASWAYAESIVELRTLFSGGKIASVKTAESWTVSLPEAAVVLFNTSIKSKEVTSGFSYEDYLQAFLSLEKIEKIGKRFADLLEKNLRLYDGYEQVKLDCMITAMETDYIYHAQQAFLSFVTIQRLSGKGYQFEEKYAFSYQNLKDSS